MRRATIVVHGGCGVMARQELDDAAWEGARQDLARALRAGWALLDAGGSAIAAVEAAVIVMEDSPHFNAGRGAALNNEGEHELDASIMDGATLAAGAVCAVRRIRNPVRAARLLMERGDPLLLAGPAADRFAADAGLAIVQPDHFTIDRQRASLAAMRARAAAGTAARASEAEKHGTVGAVARDLDGNLAAATSTGGYTNKPTGRVGDSPIVGAGTYARNGVCAVSGTGKGELFIRHVLAHEVACRMAYRGETLPKATQGAIDLLRPYPVGAGLIACDTLGNVACPFNTAGMFRGWIKADGDAYVGTHETVRLLS